MRRHKMTSPSDGAETERDKTRIEEKRIRTALRIIQGSSKYGLERADLSWSLL